MSEQLNSDLSFESSLVGGMSTKQKIHQVVQELDQLYFDKCWTDDQWKHFFNDRSGRKTLSLLLKNQQTVIGMVFGEIKGCDYELYRIVVVPAFRERGHGKRLMQKLEGLLVENGRKSIILQVSSKNIAALKMYRSLAFNTTRRLDHYYGKDDHGLELKKEILYKNSSPRV